MSCRYFLDGGIEYIPENGELYVNGEIETLQSLENKLLEYFVTHPNQLVSKETLYNVGWSGRIHGDNPLSKAISTLRSKLKDTPRAPKYIKTVPKRGFIFISEVKSQQISTPVIDTIPASEPLAQIAAQSSMLSSATLSAHSTSSVKPIQEVPRWIFPFLAIPILMWIIISLMFDSFVEEQPQVGDIQQITNSVGQDKHPNISADNQKVVFVRQTNQFEHPQLVVKPLNGEPEKILTNEPFHHAFPSWNLAGDKILYHRYEDNLCEIIVLSLDAQYNITNEEILFECSKENRTIGLTWGPDNSIYFSDVDIPFAALKIFQFDIDSKETTTFATPTNTLGRGFYRLSYDHNSGCLMTLLTNDWFTTEIVAFDGQGKIVQQHHVDAQLFAVTSYKGGPAFKTPGNHIHYLHDDKEKRLMQSPLWPIYAPNFSQNEQAAMVFIGGEFFSSDILSIDFATKQSTPLVKGDVKHRFPYITPDNNLYYASNQSGVYQIWKSQNNSNEQLSHFKRNRNIYNIAVSADEQFIAVTINKNTLLFNANNRPFKYDKPYRLFVNHANPHFSPDGKTLWISEVNNNFHRMHAFDLSKGPKSDPQMTIDNAFIGIFDQLTAEHFIFKLDQTEVYRRKDDELIYFTKAPIINTTRSASIQNHVLTYFDDNKAKLMQLSFDTNQTKALSNTPHRYFSQYFPVNGQTNQRFAVASRKFGNTSIFLAQY